MRKKEDQEEDDMASVGEANFGHGGNSGFKYWSIKQVTRHSVARTF